MLKRTVLSQNNLYICRLNEATWIIVAGLCFDITGAYVVLRPLIHLYKRYWGDEKPNLESREGRFISYDKDIVESQKRDMKDAKIGFSILVTGFVLQLIGNLIQNPPK